MVVCKQRGHIENGALVLQNGDDDPVKRQCDSIGSGAFGVNDFICGVLGTVKDIFSFFVRQIDSDTGNVGDAPERQLRIAVFADDMGVNAARINAFVLPDQITEAGAVEQGTGADDPINREAALFNVT